MTPRVRPLISQFFFFCDSNFPQPRTWWRVSKMFSIHFQFPPKRTSEPNSSSNRSSLTLSFEDFFLWIYFEYLLSISNVFGGCQHNRRGEPETTMTCKRVGEWECEMEKFKTPFHEFSRFLFPHILSSGAAVPYHELIYFAFLPNHTPINPLTHSHFLTLPLPHTHDSPSILVIFVHSYWKAEEKFGWNVEKFT